MSEFTTVIVVPGDQIPVNVGGRDLTYSYIADHDQVHFHLSEEKTVAAMLLPIPDDKKSEMKNMLVAAAEKQGPSDFVEVVIGENTGYVSFPKDV